MTRRYWPLWLLLWVSLAQVVFWASVGIGAGATEWTLGFLAAVLPFLAAMGVLIALRVWLDRVWP